MAPWLFLGRLRPVIARARTSRASDQPTFQATTDRRPTDRPRRRRGSPRDASRLRAVVRLRCEPLRFANFVDVRPRASRSSPSARINPRRSAIVGARACAIVGTRDFSLPPSLSPSHRKKRRRARERSLSVSWPPLSQWPASDRAVAIVIGAAFDDISV